MIEKELQSINSKYGFGKENQMRGYGLSSAHSMVNLKHYPSKRPRRDDDIYRSVGYPPMGSQTGAPSQNDEFIGKSYSLRHFKY